MLQNPQFPSQNNAAT